MSEILFARIEKPCMQQGIARYVALINHMLQGCLHKEWMAIKGDSRI